MFWGIALFVTVWFDGVAIPGGCLVDTGASATVLRRSEAARLGTLGPPGSTATFTAASDTTFVATSHRIPNVGTADLGWSSATVWVVPDGQLSQACILGTDLLGQQPIIIDWYAQRVRRA